MIVFQRLTTTKLNRIFLCFSEDLTATATARITGVNRNTVNRYFTGIREKIVRHSIAEYNELMNGIKAETLRFEAKTVLGKRLKRVLQERPILGLLRRGKKVFITVLEDFSHDNLLTRLQENLHERYAALYENETARTEAVSLNEYDQYRVWHAGAEQESDEHDVKGIENFLTFAKKRLAKFNGCSSSNILLHLKECEFRYNHRGEDLFKLIKKIFQKY